MNSLPPYLKNKKSNRNIVSNLFYSIMQSDMSSFLKKATKDNSCEKLIEAVTKEKITNREGGKGFVVNGTTIYPGLLRVMASNFYPNRQESKNKRGGSSKKQGERIHSQIEHFINCTPSGICSCSTPVKRASLLVKNAFSKFKSIGFTPVRSEVPIFSKNGRFCTRIDIIGYIDKGKDSQRSCMIEIKTGFKTHLKRDGKKTYFNKPLEEIYASSQNIHQLQLASMAVITEKEYGIQFGEHKIIYLRKELNECNIVDAAIWWKGKKEKKEQIYNSLRNKN